MSGGPWEIGTRDDAESVAGRGTVIPILKRIRTLLGSGVPGATMITDPDGDIANVCPSMEALSTKRISKCIDNCESIVGWAGSTDVSGIALSAVHRGPGIYSLEFDKTGVTQAFAQIDKTLAAPINAAAYGSHGFLEYYLYISGAGDLGRITSVYIAMGQDNGNYWYWETPVAELAVGWQHIHHPLSNIDGDLALGCVMNSIAWISVYVTLTGAADALTDMRIDDIRLRTSDAVACRDTAGLGYAHRVKPISHSELGLAAHVHEPAANTAAIVTLAAAGAGVANVLGMAFWSYDILPAAGSLTIEDGAGTTVIKVDIPESGPGFLPFNPGLRGSANTLLRATLAAGGAGVSGIVSLHAWTE